MSETAVREISSLEASCPICHGRGIWGVGDSEYPCHCRTVPEPGQVRKVLARLSVKQMAFLRAFEHTLAYQAVSQSEFDEFLMEYWVEEDDAVHDGYDLIMPATKVWFASGLCSSGPDRQGWNHWIKYNPLGLALRQCLMCGPRG